MKVGKFINNEMHLVEVENGKEVSGKRTEQELYKDGYEKVCEVDKPTDYEDSELILNYMAIPGGWIQVWDIVREDFQE